ncbi:hypothetical protein KR044_009212 [Drosophila immigrans]|nr:hypothetical protein KR044_009212 [Drosophila immigrans]
MRIFAKCLLLAFCLKRHQDDEQTFADQLEQPSATVVHIEQPQPDEDANLERSTSSDPKPGTQMRGSHSPAQLEEISICADVHESGGAKAERTPPAESETNGNERFSGVAIKDEIEIFTDCCLLMCLECCCGCCGAKASHAPSRQLPCQDIQLMELHGEKKITITQQPVRGNNAYNPCSVRPYSWNCEDDENCNVEDGETRTPTMWRAWWLKSGSE